MTGGYGVSVASDSQAGLQSDYNLLYVTGTGQVGRWQNVPRDTLIAWQNAAFTDQNSLSQDPLFVDPAGLDGILGYQDATHDGSDDDFHLQSSEGRFTGSLTPVFDSNTNRITFLPTSELTDVVQSVAIDRGDASFSFVNEPSPNGAFVNLGAYGNTEQASKSPAEYVLVTLPDGSEVWPSDRTFPIRWRSEVLGKSPGGHPPDSRW